MLILKIKRTKLPLRKEIRDKKDRLITVWNRVDKFWKCPIEKGIRVWVAAFPKSAKTYLIEVLDDGSYVIDVQEYKGLPYGTTYRFEREIIIHPYDPLIKGKRFREY